MYKIILFGVITFGLACKSIQEKKSVCFGNILEELNLDTNWIYNSKLEYYEDKLPLSQFINDSVKYRCFLSNKIDTSRIIMLFGVPSNSGYGTDSSMHYTYCTYPPQGIKQCCYYYYTFRFTKSNILYEIMQGGCTPEN